MKKNNNAILKLNTKPHTGYGIAAFIMAIISIICILTSIILSATIAEMTRSDIILIGVLEWISLMLNIAGFGIAIIGEGARDMEKIFAHISLLLHFIGLIYHGYVFWFGFIA